MAVELSATSGARRHDTYRVFVGSTSVDLHAHRAKVADTIAKMDQFAVTMNDFGARAFGDATTVSLDELATCDIYILLVAWRYGFVPTGQPYSVTQLEYREAKRLRRPTLVFLADPSTEYDAGPDALFPVACRDWPEHRQQTLEFRAEVSDGNKPVVDYFTDAGDLASRVAAALYRMLRDLRPVPRVVPKPIPHFIGRSTELAALCADLLAGQSVGLSAAVAGMAGVGKSALAVETLRAIAAQDDAFPGGISWVRCDGRTGLSGLMWVYDQLLAAWGMPLPPEQQSQRKRPDSEVDQSEVELREQVLRAQLLPASAQASPPPALVLLDNVERGLPLARALEHLSPLGMTLLVTSRQDIEIVGFQQRSLGVLAHRDAVELFRSRFIERGGTWVEARDSQPASHIVSSLGHLPLAIELAAARVARGKKGVLALAEELSTAIQLNTLQDTQRGAQSLNYIFSQSIAQLSRPLQVRFAALGLPDGPDWPRFLIQNLLRGIQVRMAYNGADKTANLSDDCDDLELLASYSLVTLVGADEIATGAALSPYQALGRVRLHPLLRAHAGEEWSRLPATVRTSGLSVLLSEVGAMVARHGQDYALLAREEQLITSTLLHAARNGVELLYVCEVITQLTHYLNLGGHWRLGIELFEVRLAIERDQHERLREGTTLNGLGRFAERLGKLHDAAHYYEAALDIRRSISDYVGEGITLASLGNLSILLGKTSDASSQLNAALTIHQHVHNRRGVGSTLNSLGRLAESLDKLDDAVNYYQQALTVWRGIPNSARRIPDRVGECATLNNLGQLVVARGGDQDEAKRYYERALEACVGVDPVGVVTTLTNLGVLAQVDGRLDEAASYFERALDMMQSLGMDVAKEAVSARLAEVKNRRGGN